ncbi:hypothetical protein [Desulfurobacterium sp.]|uniref:hypothetical protein n=1 Tax=Desulfurobacterium sp. TaxID=2004706 RepID=UPI00261230BD|nr:hypothetical protein [Desulfurobacterium sp.]
MKISKLLNLCAVLLVIPFSASGDIFFSLDKLKPKKEKSSNSNFQVPETKVDPSKFKLTGIVDGRVKMAIINGKLVKISDKIDSCVVRKIQPKKGVVTLDCNGYDINLMLNEFKGSRH